MRSALLFLLAASVASLAPAPAPAGAGVSPFLVAVVSPDSLDAGYHAVYDFSGVDAVYVMSVDDARSTSWRGYVWGPHGQPVIGGVSYAVATPEVLAITDSAVVSRTMIAVADDALLQDLIDESLVGPCGHEPALEGTVEADLLSSAVDRALRGLSAAEPAVAVAAYGLRTTPVTDLSASTTGTIAVTVINPDSMAPGGWCGANPTPHP